MYNNHVIIMNRVCEEFNITPNILFKKSKAVQFVRPRQIFFYFCKKYTNYTIEHIASIGQYYEIGMQLNRTVTNSMIAVDNVMHFDAYFDSIQRLDEKLEKNISCN